MSRVIPIVLAIFVSSGILVQVTLSAPMTSNRYLFAAALTLFLASIQLLFLLTNFTMSLSLTSVRFISNLSFVTMIVSFNTLVPPFPMFNTIQSWGIGSAICWGLLCFVISMLYQSISKAPRCYRRCLHVAFLTLCIGFAGLYIDPLSYLQGKIQYNAIIHGMKYLYQFDLVPANFVLGTILVIFNITSWAGLIHPFVSVAFKEGMTVLTLAVALSTLIIGGSLTIFAALVNLAMASGFDVRGLVRSVA